MYLIVALIVGIPLFGIGLHAWIVRCEHQVFRSGANIQAKVVEVRHDEGDWIVRYRFVDPLSGKSYERSGIAGFQMTNPPVEGDLVDIKYLVGSPKWSRLVSEIKMASSPPC